MATPAFGRIGWGGLEAFLSGFSPDLFALIDPDHNASVRGMRAFAIWDKMRRADPVVAALMRLVKQPLRSATWSIAAASDDARDRARADAVSEALFTRDWPATLNAALLHLDYGVAPLEIVWRRPPDERRISGRREIGLEALELRRPHTVQEWLVDDGGEFAGITQMITSGPRRLGMVTIPAEKLVLVQNEPEGVDPRGMSLMRPMFGSWFIKSRMLMIDAVAKQRRGAGMDVGTLKNTDSETKDAAEKSLATARTHEHNYLLEVEDVFSYRIEGVQGTTLNPLETIRYHDLSMMRSLLAEHLGMGEGATGSFAMHADKTSVAFMMLEGVARQITSAINDVLSRWQRVIASDRDPPTLVHSRLDARDVASVARTVADLTRDGVITDDDRALERELRDMLDLPQLGSPEATRTNAARRRRGVRTPTRLDGVIDASRLRGVMDDGADRVTALMGQISRRLSDRAIDAVSDAFASGRSRDALLGIVSEALTPTTEDRERLARALETVMLVGAEEVVAETSRQRQARGQRVDAQLGEPLESGEENEQADLQAASLLAAIRARLSSTILTEAAGASRDGRFDSQRVRDLVRSLAESETARRSVGAVSEAMSAGRRTSAQRIFGGGGTRAIYSSVLEAETTCAQCQSADGAEVVFPSAEFDDINPPLRSARFGACDGGSRCRCIMQFVLDEDL